MHSLVERKRKNRACCLPCEENTGSSLFQLSVKFLHCTLDILLDSASFSCFVFTLLSHLKPWRLKDAWSHMTRPLKNKTLHQLFSKGFMYVITQTTPSCWSFQDWSLCPSTLSVQPPLKELNLDSTFFTYERTPSAFISKVQEKITPKCLFAWQMEYCANMCALHHTSKKYISK